MSPAFSILFNTLKSTLGNIFTQNCNRPGAFNLCCFPTAPNCYRLLFWGGIALALALRVGALFALKDSLYFKFLLWDEEYYHEWAQAILLNDLTGYLSHEYAPLPAYFMALIYKIFGPEIILIRYANILLGTGSCWLIYLIGKELNGKKYALPALYCAALCQPLIFFSVVVLKTSLAVFLFGLLIYLILSNRRLTGWWNRIFLGVVFGLIFNVRPNVLILLPLLPFLVCSFSEWRMLYLKNILKTGAFLAIGFVIAISPFALQNYRTQGSLQILPLQSGFLLYANNNPANSTLYYQPVSFASSHPKEQGIQFTIEASKRVGRKMTVREASAFWRHQVLMDIVEHPWHWFKKMGWKTLSFLNFTEVDDHYHIGFIGIIVPWFSLAFIPYWLFFLFGITGLTVGTIQKRHRHNIGPLTVIVFAYAATLILYSTGNRFQIPLLVILIPMTIFTGKELFFLFKERALKKGAWYLISLLFFSVAGLTSLQGGGTLAGHYNTYAFLLNRNGQEKEAIEWWEKSTQLDEPYSAYANLFLSGKYYQLYGMEKAIATLNKIPDNSFAAAAKYAALGDIQLHHGHVEQAEELYKKSLAINSGQRRVRMELIRILRHKMDGELDKEIKQLEFITSFYN